MLFFATCVLQLRGLFNYGVLKYLLSLFGKLLISYCTVVNDVGVCMFSMENLYKIAFPILIFLFPLQVLGQSCPYTGTDITPNTNLCVVSSGVKSGNFVEISNNLIVAQGVLVTISGSLTVIGNITLGKSANIYVCGGGKLIVKGGLTLGNQSNVSVASSGLLIATGDVNAQQGNILIGNSGNLIFTGKTSVPGSSTVTTAAGASTYIFDDVNGKITGELTLGDLKKNTSLYYQYLSAVQPCTCSSDNYVSLDDGKRNWEDANTWVQKWIGQTLPPSTSGQNDRICIKGTVFVNGNLKLISDPTICDTLVVTGDLEVNSYNLVLNPTGVLIVLGNFKGGSGNTNFMGRMVVQGAFTSPYSNSINNMGGNLYVENGPINYQTNPGQGPVVQDGNDLKNNDVSLYDYYTDIKCRLPAFDGGQIFSTVGTPACFSGTPISINNQLSATPADASYSWQVAIDDSPTWISVPVLGIMNCSSLSSMDILSGASTVQAIKVKVRRVASKNSCKFYSNVLEFYRTPVTGPSYHISNKLP